MSCFNYLWSFLRMKYMWEVVNSYCNVLKAKRTVIGCHALHETVSYYVSFDEDSRYVFPIGSYHSFLIRCSHYYLCKSNQFCSLMLPFQYIHLSTSTCSYFPLSLLFFPYLSSALTQPSVSHQVQGLIILVKHSDSELYP